MPRTPDRRGFLLAGAVAGVGALAARAPAAHAHDGSPELHIEDAETVTGSKTFDAHALFASGEPWADVRAFGAVVDGVTDDTAAIQAAINSLPPTGGVVLLSPGVHKVGGTINLRSNVTLRGTFGMGNDNNTDVKRGTTLNYLGGGGVPVLRLFNVDHVVVEGIHIFANYLAITSAVLLDSDGTRATHDVVLRNLALSYIGGNRSYAPYYGPAVAIQVGLPGDDASRVHSVRLERVKILEVDTGIRVHCVDGLDNSTLTDFTIQAYYNVGMDFRRVGNVLIQRHSLGCYEPHSFGLLLSGDHGAVVLKGGVIETGGTDIRVAAHSGSKNGPLTLIGNAFSRQTIIEQPGQHVVSMGNFHYSTEVLLVGANVTVVSYADQFATLNSTGGVVPAFHKIGAGSQVLEHRTTQLGPFWRFDSRVEGLVARFAAAGPNANPGVAVANEGPGGGEWQLLAPGAGGSAPGAFAIADGDAQTTPVTIDGAAPTGALTVGRLAPIVELGVGIGAPVLPGNTLGAVKAKAAVLTTSGVPAGFLPVYDAITATPSPLTTKPKKPKEPK